jgi:energy-coupling factor transporter ATP-binding protein EcfA2
MMNVSSIVLPDGEGISGCNPVVIIGANGSGKTRLSRTIKVEGGGPPEFINALRNTHVSAKISAMAPSDAQQNLTNSRERSRSRHWDISSDFDHLLALLVAEDASAAVEFRDAVQGGDDPEEGLSNLQELKKLWGAVFPGRSLQMHKHEPTVTNVSESETVTYSAESMSDGERAALYVLGTVLRSEAAVLVVDEHETHMHHLLAMTLWDALERARPDTRFVYVTHDIPFALSRSKATYVLAHPTAGLRVLEVDRSLPESVLESILGTASFSFHASRIVACEGDATSKDVSFYQAWFRSPGTVVRAVGGCDDVIRVAVALSRPDFFSVESVVGVIDRDMQPDGYLNSLPKEIHPLFVHEVESLYALPGTVAAVSSHLGLTFSEGEYLGALRSSIDEQEVKKCIVERWKRRMEPRLETTLSSVKAEEVLEEMSNRIDSLLDSANWGYSPKEFFEDERSRVSDAMNGSAPDLLAILPGKPRLAVAAQTVGIHHQEYVSLINRALRGEDPNLAQLGSAVEHALSGYLPPR